MDDPISKARKRRQELRAELAKVEEFLRLYGELFGPDTEQSEPPSTASDVRVASSSKRKRRIRPKEIADAALRLIREAGQPMVRGELASALETAGIRVPSGDKPRYVGTILWRDGERFVNLEGHGYWLRGVDYLPALYVAENDPEGVGKITPKADDRRKAEADLLNHLERIGGTE